MWLKKGSTYEWIYNSNGYYLEGEVNKYVGQGWKPVHFGGSSSLYVWLIKPCP